MIDSKASIIFSYSAAIGMFEFRAMPFHLPPSDFPTADTGSGSPSTSPSHRRRNSSCSRAVIASCSPTFRYSTIATRMFANSWRPPRASLLYPVTCGLKDTSDITGLSMTGIKSSTLGELATLELYTAQSVDIEGNVDARNSSSAAPISFSLRQICVSGLRRSLHDDLYSCWLRFQDSPSSALPNALSERQRSRHALQHSWCDVEHITCIPPRASPPVRP